MLKRILVITGAVLTLTTVGVMAAPAQKTARGNTKSALVCPVLKHKIASPAQASGKSVYKGKTYYFCCAGCKPMFDKNPAKYLGKK